MLKNLDQQLNSDEEQADKIEKAEKNMEEKEKIDPIRAEFLMNTGNFESQEEAEKCLEQMDIAFQQQERSDEIIEKFTNDFEQIIEEAKIQMKSIEQLSEGEIIDKEEMFQGILKGIAENFEDLQLELKGIKEKKVFLLWKFLKR